MTQPLEKPRLKRPTLDDPEYRRRIIRACIFVSPLGFAIAFLLGLFQGVSPEIALLMGLVLAAGCFGAAGLVHLRGTEAGKDVMWVIVLLKLFGMK